MIIDIYILIGVDSGIKYSDCVRVFYRYYWVVYNVFGIGVNINYCFFGWIDFVNYVL